MDLGEIRYEREEERGYDSGILRLRVMVPLGTEKDKEGKERRRDGWWGWVGERLEMSRVSFVDMVLLNGDK